MRDAGTASRDASWHRLTVLALAGALLVVGVGLPTAAASAVTSSDTATAASGNFAVSIDSTNSPVREGETLVVRATVENTGSSTGTQTINLTVADRLQNSTSLTLDPGENKSVRLSTETGDGDAGTYTATIASANDSADTLVEVKGNPRFVVQNLSTNSPVAENTSVNVTATIANMGDGADTQTVRLLINGKLNGTTQVSLGPGENTNVTLRWETGPGDAGEYNATIATEDDSSSGNVTVLVPRNFSVSVEGTTSPVFAGDPLVVNAVVTNLADDTATKTVTLSVGGGVRDSRDVTLASGESTNLSLTWETGAGDAGNYTATVASPNASGSVNVTVRPPPGDSEVVDGTTYYLGQVLYTGVFADNTTVDLQRADGTDIAALPVGADGVLTLQTADRATGSYELVGSNGTTIAFDLVEQRFSIQPTTPAVKASGQNTTVNLSVTSNRTGYRQVVTSPQLDAAAIDDVLSGVDGIRTDRDGDGTAESLVIPNASGDQSLTAAFAGMDPGTYTLRFTVPDTGVSDAVTVTVTVNDAPTAVIGAVNASVGEQVTVEPSISGDSPIVRYQWEVDGDVVSESGTLTYTFSEGGEHRITLTVTDDAGATATAVRTVVVARPTPTPTATDTATATPTDTSDGSGPGFGATAALVAVLAGVLWHRRR